MVERLVIVVPAYQAAKTLAQLFCRLPETVIPRIHRLIAVDDGSSDETFATLQRLSGSYPFLQPLQHPTNRGYGGALKTLIGAAIEADADAIVVLHADGQYAPESLPDLLAPLDNATADLVQGSRLLGGGALDGGMPRYKYIANRILTFIENRAFGLRLAEYHSGYMAYNRRFVAAIPWQSLSDSFDFDLELIALARGYNFRIAEVPIPTRYADEVSHLRSIPYGLRVLRVVTRYLCGGYRPAVQQSPPTQT